MALLEPHPPGLSSSGAPAKAIEAFSGNGAFGCGGCSSSRRDTGCSDTWEEDNIRRKRRRPLPASDSETTIPVAEPPSASIQRQRVRNTSVKHFDPVTRRFVFLSFAQQLQQHLQHRVGDPLYRTSALDLLQQQQYWLRHSIGCAGIRPTTSETADDDTRLRKERYSDLEYSAFRAMVQEYISARNPALLASLLSELQPLCSALPLLILERQRIVHLLLRHILREECCNVVLALLQGLAKDLRAELAPYLPSIFSTLLLVLQQLENAADAERLSLLFACVSNILRYLSTPLLDDFRFILELYLPWLCGAVATDGRQPWCENKSGVRIPSEREQAQDCQKLPERESPHATDSTEAAEEDLEISSISADAVERVACRSAATGTKGPGSKKRCHMSAGAAHLAAVQTLAAQAFACLLRKAAADEDAGTLFRCVHELMMCLSRCPPRCSWTLAEAFARILFETVRSVHHCLSSSFDRLLRFLLTCVLFQKPYKDALSGSVYSPTASCFPSEPALTASTVIEEHRDGGQFSAEQDKLLATESRERKRRRQAPAAGVQDVVRCHPTGEEAAAEILWKESTGRRSADPAEHYLEQGKECNDATRRIVQSGFWTVNSSGDYGEAPRSSSPADSESSVYSCAYFCQVHCLEILLQLIRMHAGSMQSKAAEEVQALLLEFLTAALKAVSVSAECRTTETVGPRPSEEAVKIEAGDTECHLAGICGRITADTCATISSGVCACTTGHQRHNLVWGTGCLPFDDFLRSSFLPYFYQRPAPRSLRSHPYFHSCGAWLSQGKPDSSGSLQQEASIHNILKEEKARRVNASRRWLSVRARMESDFYMKYGLLSLFEFVGDWAAAVPRLQGSFNDFAQRLLLVLAPSALAKHPGRKREMNGNSQASNSLTRTTAIPSIASVLRPLVDCLHCSGGALCSPRPPITLGMDVHLGDAAEVRLYEAHAVFAVLLPCALLRLIAFTWRAVPKSWVAALDTVAPDLLGTLLLHPRELEQHAVWRHRQDAPLAARLRQELQQHRFVLMDTYHTADCWRVRLADLYLDCCFAFIALLQHPDLLSEDLETCSKSLQGPVDGYALYASQAIFEFLVVCFSDLHPYVRFSSKSAKRLRDSAAAYHGGTTGKLCPEQPITMSRRYNLSASQWRAGASGILLVKQLHLFTNEMRLNATLSAACACRGLSALAVAFDELLHQVGKWDVMPVNAPERTSPQLKKAQTDFFLYAWGLVACAESLFTRLSAFNSWLPMAKAERLACQQTKDILARLSCSAQEVGDRLLKFISGAIIWIVRELTRCAEYSDYEEVPSEVAESDKAEAPRTKERHRTCSQNARQKERHTMLDASCTRAELTQGQLAMVVFQVVRDILRSPLTLTAGCSLSTERLVSNAFVDMHQLACILQQLAHSREPDEGASVEDFSSLSSSGVPVGEDEPTSTSFRNQATSRRQTIAFRVLRMLFRDTVPSVVPVKKLEILLQPTCSGGELTQENIVSVNGEHTQSRPGTLHAVPPAAKWTLLLLSVFDGLARGPSSDFEITRPFLLPLLQCCLDCFSRLFAEGDDCEQRIEGAQNGEVINKQGSRAVADSAGKPLNDGTHEFSITPLTVESGDSAQKPTMEPLLLEKGLALVTAAVSESLPVLVPCLSSPCRSLRLTVARLLLHASIAAGQLVPVGAFGRSMALSTALTLTTPTGTRREQPSLMDRNPYCSLSRCRDIFQRLIELESTDIGLHEERRLTRLVGIVAQATVHLVDEFVCFPQKQLKGEGPRSSTEEDNTWRGSYAPHPAFAFECALRVLIAQFSVKFIPLWQAAGDALHQLVQGAAQADQLLRRALRDSLVEKDNRWLQEGRLSDTPIADFCVGSPPGLLRLMWRILTDEVHRTEVDLKEGHATCTQSGRRKPLVRKRIMHQHAEDPVCEDTEVPSNSSCHERSAQDIVDQTVDIPSYEALNATDSASTSHALVLSAWHRLVREMGGGQDLLEHGLQEADALSRHTQLLRVIEDFHCITLSRTNVEDVGQIIHSPRTEEDTGNLLHYVSAGRTNDEYVESGENELCESSNLCGVSAVLPGAKNARSTPGAYFSDTCGMSHGASHAIRRDWQQGSSAHQLYLMEHVEALERAYWTLSEALRLVSALTTDAADEWAASELNDTEADDSGIEHLQPSQRHLLSDRKISCVRTSCVSLIPRTCSVLRAVVALGTTRLTRSVLPGVQLRPACSSSPSSPEESHQAVKAEQYTAVEEEHKRLTEAVSDLWDRLLSCCAQRLISVADSTLQQLSLKVLLLSPTMRSRLQPYVPVLEQLIANKGVSDILLRLHINDSQQTVAGILNSEAEHAALAQKEGKDPKLGASDAPDCDTATQSGVFLLSEHKATVLPLLVRILLTKVQQRATKRSATTSFSQRRTILSFIAAVATEELPLVLAVLLYPLVSVRLLRCPSSEDSKEVFSQHSNSCSSSDSAGVGAAERAVDGRERVTTGDSAAAASDSSVGVRSFGSATAGLRPRAESRYRLDSVPQQIVSGFAKEDILRRIVLETAAPRMGEVRNYECGRASHASGPTSIIPSHQSVLQTTEFQAEAVTWGDSEGLHTVPGSSALIVQMGLPQDGSVVAINLAAACLPPRSLNRLRGSLETLKQLQELVGQLMHPAAPLLVKFYCTLLQRLAAKQNSSQTHGDIASAAAASVESADSTTVTSSNDAGEADLSAEPVKACQKSMYQKAVVHTVLLLLKQLLHLFPKDAAAWQRLLRPAAPALQRLLETAVATAAASPVYSCGPGKKGRQEKESIPAIISLVASWASHPAYYCFFTKLLPHALSVLFRVPAAPAVLRQVCLRHKMWYGSKSPHGRSLGVLDAAIEVALELSGGSSEPGQQQLTRQGTGHSETKKRSRNRRRRERRGGESSTSESEDFPDDEGVELPGATTDPLIQQQHRSSESEEQTLLRATEYQREGMRILRPYLPVLLKSLETLFQHRCAAAESLKDIPERVSLLSGAPSDHVATDSCEDLNKGSRSGAERENRGQHDRGNDAGSFVVSIKELHLLTLVAEFTADECEDLQPLDGEPKVATAEGRASLEGTHCCRNAGGSVACSLVRLLLQCLSSGSTSGGYPRRQQGDLRHTLTLRALRRLTLPLAMRIRALRENSLWLARERHRQNVEKQTPAKLSCTSMAGTKVEAAGSRVTGTCVEGQAASDVITDTLGLIVKRCCQLLQESRSMQCRVAATELLLAAELAACGLPHSDTLLKDVLHDINTALRRRTGGVSEHGGVDAADWGGAAATVETYPELRVNEGVIDALVPGGSILTKFLQRAMVLSYDKMRGPSLELKKEETRCHTEGGLILTTASAAEAAAGCTEIRQQPPNSDPLDAIGGSSSRIVSALAEVTTLATGRVYKGSNEGRAFNDEQPLLAKAFSHKSKEEQLVLRTHWHIGVALILFCMNAGRSYGRSLANSFMVDEEELPDSDNQIIILSTMAQQWIHFQVPFPGHAVPVLDGATHQEELPEHEEARTDTSGALQVFNHSTGLVSAVEPLVRHCLYLLTSSVVEWSLQQVALNVIKRFVDSVVAAATHYSSAVLPDSNPSCEEVASPGTSSCATAAAHTKAGRETKIRDILIKRQYTATRSRQAAREYACGMIRHLAELVMPTARLLLKRFREDQWRVGVQLIEHIVRSFAPVAQPLAHVTACSNCNTMAFASPTANTSTRMIRLQQLFNLDLACLVLRTPRTSPGEEQCSLIIAAAPERPEGTTLAPSNAVQAAVAASSSRNAGGDFFIDLLHVQRHRRGRALQRMAAAAMAGLLSRYTLQTVGLPLGISALLQCESCVTKQQQKQRSGRQRQLFHQGLCEQGVKLLEICCARVPWKRCLRVIKLLSGFLVRVPKREAFIYRAICGAVSAFEKHAKAARAGGGVHALTVARPADFLSCEHCPALPGKQIDDSSCRQCTDVPSVHAVSLNALVESTSEAVLLPENAGEVRMSDDNERERKEVSMNAPQIFPESGGQLKATSTKRENLHSSATEFNGDRVLSVDALALQRETEDKDIKDNPDEAYKTLDHDCSAPVGEEQPLMNCSSVPSASRLERLQACIRSELLPLLFRLLFPSCRTRASASDQIGVLETWSGRRYLREPVGRSREGDEAVKSLNPTLIVVCVLLMKLLPRAVFEEELPRLVRLVAFRLRSRDRDVRRQARGALVSIASKMGASFVPYLARELNAMFRSTASKSENSQQCAEAATVGSRAVWSSVLLFTLHAVVHHVVHPRLTLKTTIALHPSRAAVQEGCDATALIHDTESDPCGSTTAPAHEAGSGTKEDLAPGCLDEAFPVLLPLVAEDLSRTCDSDRPPSTHASETDKPGSKNDEARQSKSAALIYLLSSVCSRASCEELMIPFFHALLKGEQLVCTWSGSDGQLSAAPQQQKMIIRQRQGTSTVAAFSSAYLERIRELFLHFAKGLNMNTGLNVEYKLILSRWLLVMAVSIMQQQRLHPLRQLRCRRKELLELALAQQQLELHAARFPYVASERSIAHFLADEKRSRSSTPGIGFFNANTAGANALAAGQVQIDLTHTEKTIETHRSVEHGDIMYGAVESEIRFFRKIYLRTSLPFGNRSHRKGAAQASATYSQNEMKVNINSDDGPLPVGQNLQTGNINSLRAVDFQRREDLRMAVAVRKDRAMLTQPGAASGRSLEQAIALQRTVTGKGAGGFDDCSRAAVIGGVALRLLLLTLKTHKAKLREGLAVGVHRGTAANFLGEEKGAESNARSPHANTVAAGHTAHQMRSLCCKLELEKCVENVVCSFCSTHIELTACAARCLIHMLGLKLRELNRLGSVVAYSAMKVFQAATENASPAQQKQNQQLLAPCTRLLTILLLRPQSSTWLDKALYGSRSVPQTHDDFLQQQMRQQAQHQVKAAAAARKALLREAIPKQKHRTQRQRLEGSADCQQTGGQQEACVSQSRGSYSAGYDTGVLSRSSTLNYCQNDDFYREVQARLLKIQEDVPITSAVDARRQQEKFREALVAHIGHALEIPQTRLSALMLFKSVVLPHYREIAAGVLAGNSIEESHSKSSAGTETKQGHQTENATQKKGSLAGYSVLKEVYRCIDVIARLMIQEAADSGGNKRLGILCADVYIHFLMNFPMTARAQQRKILFLIKNLGYTAVDGRRAVLNCIYKILCRFPYELTVEKYSDILMVTLCRRLAFEDDPVTHSMLRMLVGQLLRIPEDLQDGRHSSFSLLRTCAEVLLQPKLTSLLAVEELTLIFIDVQGARRERRLLQKILPLLNRTIVLGETTHNAFADGRSNSHFTAISACCGRGCCGGLDWRVCYKALLIFEKLILLTQPSELDKILAKTVRQIQRFSHSAHFMRLVSTDEAHGRCAHLAEVLYKCQFPRTGAAYGANAVGCTMGMTPDVEDLVDASQNTSESDSEVHTDGGVFDKAVSIESLDAACGFALARVWLLAANAGITHSHPWIRAVSLRCVGFYLRAKLYSGLKRNSPCLLFLPLQNQSPSMESCGSFGGYQYETMPGQVETERLIREGHWQHEYADVAKRGSLTNAVQSGKTTGFSSNPGVGLLRAALKPFGQDDFVERCPQAVPAVYILMTPLLKLVIEKPDFFIPTQAVDGEEGECSFDLGRHATRTMELLSTVKRGCDRIGLTGARTVTEKTYAAASDETPSEERTRMWSVGLATAEQHETIVENNDGTGGAPIGKRTKRTKHLDEVQVSSVSKACEHPHGEYARSSDFVPQTSAVVGSTDGCAANLFHFEAKQARDEVQICRDHNEDVQKRNDATKEDSLVFRSAAGRTTQSASQHTDWRSAGEAPGDLAVPKTHFSSNGQASAVANSPPRSHEQTKVCSATGLPYYAAPAGVEVKRTAHNAVDSCSSVTKTRVFICEGSTQVVTNGDLNAEKQMGRHGSEAVRAMTGRSDCALETITTKQSRCQRECGFILLEGTHPLLSVVRKLLFWLRLHLGSLGKRDMHQTSDKGSHRRSILETGRPARCGTVTRVGAILSAFHCILYMLPLKTSCTKAVATAGVLTTRTDKKRKLEAGTQLAGQQNKLKNRYCSDTGDASVPQTVEDRDSQREFQGGKWMYSVALLLIEAFFRCSTNAGGDHKRQDANKGDHLINVLARLQDHVSSGQLTESLYAEAQQTKHHWEQLSALDPQGQQAEVAAAGGYLLECFRGRMGGVGLEGIFLHLLATVRGKVLKQRMERKIQLRQQAVVRPKQFAERRRKRQQKKRVVRAAAIMKKKRQRMVGNI